MKVRISSGQERAEEGFRALVDAAGFRVTPTPQSGAGMAGGGSTALPGQVYRAFCDVCDGANYPLGLSCPAVTLSDIKCLFNSSAPKPFREVLSGAKCSQSPSPYMKSVPCWGWE